jgi:hypothetical protein
MSTLLFIFITKLKKRRTKGMAQVVVLSPEFNPQYCQKEKGKKREREKCI